MKPLSRRKLVKGFLPFSLFIPLSRAGEKQSHNIKDGDLISFEKHILSRLYGISIDRIGFLAQGIQISNFDLLIDNLTNKYWWCGHAQGLINSWDNNENVKVHDDRLSVLTNSGVTYFYPCSRNVTVGSISEILSFPTMSDIILELKNGPRKGVFKYYYGDFSTQVASDRERGIYVPSSSDIQGFYGCWVRQYGQKNIKEIDRHLYLNVDWFGADPSGVDYSSDAIRNAFELSNCIRFNGKYRFNGKAISSGYFSIQGNNSSITLDDNVTFICSMGVVGTIFVQDINFINGSRCFDFSKVKRCDYTVTRILKNISFKNYSEIAIHLPEIDCPWWTVEQCVFIANSSNGTIGLWNNGGDNNSIRYNKFYKNEVHISTSLCQSHNIIFNNDFGQFEESKLPRANIWVRTPNIQPVFTGSTGVFVIESNKFGNENECENDVKLLFANVDKSALQPDYMSSAGGLGACHLVFKNNFHLSRSSNTANWMRSVGGWMPQSLTFELDNLQYGSFFKKERFFCFMDHHNNDSYKIYIRPLAYRDSDLLFRGNVSNNRNVNFSLLPFYNSILDGDPDIHSSFSSGIGLATKDITKTILPKIGISKAISFIPCSDSLGLSECVSIEFTSKESYASQFLHNVTESHPAWFEGELLLDSNAISDEIVVSITYITDDNINEKNIVRQVLVRKQNWTSYSFPFSVQKSNAHSLILKVQQAIPLPVTVMWARSRVYLSRSPGLVGNQKIGNLILSEIPFKPDGLPQGAIWCDKENGNVLRIVD